MKFIEDIRILVLDQVFDFNPVDLDFLNNKQLNPISKFNTYQCINYCVGNNKNEQTNKQTVTLGYLRSAT